MLSSVGHISGSSASDGGRVVVQVTPEHACNGSSASLPADILSRKKKYAILTCT